MRIMQYDIGRKHLNGYCYPEEPQQNKLSAAGPAFAAKLFAKTHLHDLQHAPNMCFESQLQSKSMPAIPCRMHKVSFDLRSLAAQGPDSTGGGTARDVLRVRSACRVWKKVLW